MIIPKWTGSTPKVLTTGSRIGVQIKSSGARSIRHPSTSSMMLISIRITSLIVRKRQEERGDLGRQLHECHHIAERRRAGDQASSPWRRSCSVRWTSVGRSRQR